MRGISVLAVLILAAAPAQSPAQVVTPQISNTAQALIGLHAVNDRVVWAGGAGGTFLRTTDGGEHWRAGVVPGAEMVQFRDVHALDSLTAWLLSIPAEDSARIYHTTDGGEHWTLQFRNQDPAAFYDCFAFWDDRRAIAISDAVRGRIPILLTDDGGDHWTLLPLVSQPAADSGRDLPPPAGPAWSRPVPASPGSEPSAESRGPGVAHVWTGAAAGKHRYTHRPRRGGSRDLHAGFPGQASRIRRGQRRFDQGPDADVLPARWTAAVPGPSSPIPPSKGPCTVWESFREPPEPDRDRDPAAPASAATTAGAGSRSTPAITGRSPSRRRTPAGWWAQGPRRQGDPALILTP
jgi:hypothetical protein